ncbi:MAG: Xaa-Pro peptidase family protein [Reyranella sp.]|nr:Xaa-Pro peptidase family protein [Reyranella sp.]
MSDFLNKDRLVELLKRDKFDAIVATSPENVTYSSGYWALSQWIRRGPQSYVLLPAADLDASCIVASTSLLDLLADQDIWVKNVRRYGYFQVDRANAPMNALDRRQAELYDLPDDKGAIEALLAAIRAAGLARGRLAIDELGLLPGHWERLKDELPDAELVPAAQLFRRIRAVKTATEIDHLREAARVAERSIKTALKAARPGVTEIDLARAFHAETVVGDAYPVLGCIGFGTRSAMPNVMPSAAVLEQGQVIRFDVGGRYKHYRADIARIAVMGEADARTRQYYKALSAGVQRVLEMVKPGVRTTDLFEAAVETVRREGIPHYNRTHVGHGIGIDGYDLPDLAPTSDHIVEEGMVMCVETPYYELGWCGLQREDTIVIRRDGAESFMTLSGDLMVVP